MTDEKETAEVVDLMAGLEKSLRAARASMCDTCQGTGVAVVVGWIGGPNRREVPCHCQEGH